MFRITEDPSSGSLIQCLAKFTIVVWCYGSICCHNTDHVNVSGHDRTTIVILSKHCTRLHDDGPSVIRNMLEHF